MAWRQAYLATPSGDALGEIDKNIVPQVAAFQPGLGARTRAESGIARTARPFVDLLEQRADLHRGPAFSVRHSLRPRCPALQSHSQCAFGRGT